MRSDLLRRGYPGDLKISYYFDRLLYLFLYSIIIFTNAIYFIIEANSLDFQHKHDSVVVLNTQRPLLLATQSGIKGFELTPILPWLSDNPDNTIMIESGTKIRSLEYKDASNRDRKY